MTDELQRRSFCLIGVYRTFQLRGERRGLLYQFSLSLSPPLAVSRLFPRPTDISVSFSLLSLAALVAKCGTEEKRAFDDTCKGKQNESGAAEGRGGKRGIYYYVPGRAMPPQNNML